MDDELLLNDAPVVTSDELGDDFADYLNEEMGAEANATKASSSGADAGTAADATAALAEEAVPTLADGRPVTALTKKQAKAELDKKEYKAWKKAMKALGAGGDSDEDAAEGGGEGDTKKKEKKEKKDKSDKKEKKDRDSKKDKKDKKKSSGSKRDRRDGEDDDFTAELEGLAGDAEGLENAKRRRREKVKARTARMDNENAGEDDAYGAYDGVAAIGGASSSRRRTASGGVAAANAAVKRLSKEERERVSYAGAVALVQKMAEARKHDVAAILKSKSGGVSSSSSKISSPPIARLLIKDEVLNFARKADNEVPLVKAGFLREIAHWILDGATNELAPLDLRNIAYELLLRYGFKGSMDATHPNRVVDHEDLNAWTGIGREELETTTLGKAVNTSRQHTSETAPNRQRAVTLLQRLSRAFSGAEDDDEAGSDDGRGKRSAKAGGLAVRWPCEKNESILTPYEYITNATEVFQSKVVQVDPLDPESYLRVPPLRIRKTPIR